MKAVITQIFFWFLVSSFSPAFAENKTGKDYSKNSATKANALNLMTGVAMLSNRDRVKKTLSGQKIPFTERKSNEDRGLTFGLLQHPGLLAALNRYRIRHSLLAKLKKNELSFIFTKSKLGKAIYGFVNNKLEAALLAVPKEQLQPSEDPFSQTRFKSLLKTLDTLKGRCSSFSVVKSDSYGNPKSWSGGGCSHRGKLKVEFRPHEEESMFVLYHR